MTGIHVESLSSYVGKLVGRLISVAVGGLAPVMVFPCLFLLLCLPYDVALLINVYYYGRSQGG